MGALGRREFLTGVVGGIAGVLLGSGSVLAGKRKKPNVLFIAVDDLNDWVGCLGGNHDTITPNLDKLASRGVLFTNAHCAAPACGPSRASLMSGVLPCSSGYYKNGQPFFRKNPALKNAVTIPQHFMANGYKAVGGGKIHHGSDHDSASWDEYWPSKTKMKPDDPLPANRPINGIAKSHFDWGPLDEPDNAMGDWQVADWAIGQIKKEHNKPLFLGCGFYRPHLPWYVPQKYFDKFPLDKISLPDVKEDDLSDVPAIGQKMAMGKVIYGDGAKAKSIDEVLTAAPRSDHAKVLKHKQWRKAVQGYLSSINFMDTCLGRVIKALDGRKDSDEWVVILWSDHGWHLGEKLHWRKFALWEEATHNVMMCVAPGMTMPGGRCDEPVNLIDIYPTLVDVCGLTKKDGLDGKSLASQLLDPKTEMIEPTLTTHGRGNHSLRSRRWRYTQYSDGSEELYDHKNDPMEWDNLAGINEYAKVKEKMKSFLPKKNAEMFTLPKKVKRSGGKT